VSLDVQMASLIASVFMGVGLGASLDTYERILGKRTFFQWIRMVNDFLFWIVQALLYFGVLLYMNHGEVRLYLLIAVLLGYAVYRALFETKYRKLLDVILRIGSTIFNFTVRFTYLFLINPTKGLLKLLYRLGIIGVITIWKVVFTLMYWMFRPIFLLIAYVDKRSGQPLMKQRKMILRGVKSLLQRFKFNRKNK
jgi:spore cortex biosynthesis protein YabQ